jgi:hypothetical protein
MSEHEQDQERTLEDEQPHTDGQDQDSEPSLNAPGDAGPSGVADDDADEEP